MKIKYKSWSNCDAISLHNAYWLLFILFVSLWLFDTAFSTFRVKFIKNNLTLTKQRTVYHLLSKLETFIASPVKIGWSVWPLVEFCVTDSRRLSATVWSVV